MTRAELELKLAEQQTENAALRAVLAQAPHVPTWANCARLPNQEQLVHLMQELYTAVVISDVDGYILWVSEGFTALCGLESHQLVGRNAMAVMRSNLHEPHMLAYLQERMAANVAFQYEVQNPRPNAGWVRVKVQPIYDAEHRTVKFAGLVEDITEWKKTQLTLDESQRRFQALAENVPGVLYQWRKNFDGTSRFGYVSPKLYELFGIRVEDVTRITEFIHPDDRVPFWQSMAQAVEARLPWDYEGRLVVEGQPTRWVHGNSGVTHIDAEGINYTGIVQDVTLLKQAQVAMRERDIRWRLAVDGFGDGAWEMNLQSMDIFYSVDYKAMLGYQDEEFPNEFNTWLEHVYPDDLTEVQSYVDAYLCNAAPPCAVEYRLRCKDGSYKWVLGRYLITARDAAGEPLILTGLQTDISELKKAKEALDLSSRRLSAVITNFQEGLVLEDENRQIVLTNDAFCQLLEGNFTPAGLVGKNAGWLATKSLDFVENPVRYAARIATLLRRRKLAVGDVLQLTNGRTLQRDFTPIYDHERYIGHLWKFVDITARTKIEIDLRQREEKYRGIIESMLLGLVELDLKGRVLYVNRSFCTMTGFSEAEVLGRELAPFLLSGAALDLVVSKDFSRRDGVADSYEVPITAKNGEVKWLLVSGAPLYDDDNQHIGSIGINLDVTPQKHLETSLREAKALAEVSTRAKQDFLANMSHEIRTPMNAILGMSHLLAQTPLAASQASYLQAITTSAENLLVIINDILDLSKIEAGHLAVEHIGFSPAHLHAQVETTLRYKAEEKGLSLTTHVEPGVPVVLFGDPHRITQVLLNLVGNSVKFTEQGSVSIVCSLVQLLPETSEALVKFVVVDTGIGMEAGYLDYVFDNFSQEDSSVTRKFGGTGLGLGISKKLVELLGGELQITSQKHWGTTSCFTLRLAMGTAQDLPRKDDGPDLSSLRYDLSGKRVLLVEDNIFNRMLANILLMNMGLTVIEAVNGETAVELAKIQPFDLILMDVQMPVMDGYEATVIIRQHLQLSVPIIALTANAISGEREKCLAMGMNDYLAKPFKEASLIKMVCELLLVNN